MIQRIAPNQLRMRLDLEGEDASVSDVTSTFSDNLSLPIHRWFRYTAGFSALWVRDLIQKEKAKGRCRVLDPFAGSGTVLLEGELCGIEAMGVEAHPFITRVARAKLHWRETPNAFLNYALSILEEAKNLAPEPSECPVLIKKCFPPPALLRLDSLRRTWESRADGSALSELSWLALASILRECSPVGTAQWQYVLPNKTKLKSADPYAAFETRIYLMSDDMIRRQRRAPGPKAILHEEDARTCASVPDRWADLVVTSPPYANNYDYADATRLEMSFFGEIQGWGDLQEAVRRYLVRSCTQHVAQMSRESFIAVLDDPLIDPIRSEITDVCRQMEAERDNHGGKKPYHTMVAAYFADLARVWVSLRRCTGAGSLICFVVGDSAPYGIYAPVDKWLGELALAAGFNSYTFEKTRDRNVKWKNRKHRVPLHEGRLWVE